MILYHYITILFSYLLLILIKIQYIDFFRYMQTYFALRGYYSVIVQAVRPIRAAVCIPAVRPIRAVGWRPILSFIRRFAAHSRPSSPLTRLVRPTTDRAFSVPTRNHNSITTPSRFFVGLIGLFEAISGVFF